MDRDRRVRATRRIAEQLGLPPMEAVTAVGQALEAKGVKVDWDSFHEAAAAAEEKP